MSIAADPLNILIVVADYYRHICDELVAGAIETLDSAKATHSLVRVPGVLEIPATIAAAERSSHRPAGRSYDGFIALGAVIRGETTHHIHVGGESARAIMDMTVQGLAIGNGILTCENEDQAIIRASRKGKNKGREAAIACLTLIEVKKRLNLGGV
ncbi:MAG: 6,7-dimethyl-8-ribityllumazine synthase [Caulobacterales bacterium]|nr:6,7-dimethyl-8-ribityllumazine synthase [Caulobacterales bacterium]MCA0372989.1 6,7-dimethyl-8-ribityllumazine synthase [Pseudomonadota bacterium]